MHACIPVCLDGILQFTLLCLYLRVHALYLVISYTKNALQLTWHDMEITSPSNMMRHGDYFSLQHDTTWRSLHPPTWHDMEVTPALQHDTTWRSLHPPTWHNMEITLPSNMTRHGDYFALQHDATWRSLCPPTWCDMEITPPSNMTQHGDYLALQHDATWRLLSPPTWCDMEITSPSNMTRHEDHFALQHDTKWKLLRPPTLLYNKRNHFIKWSTSICINYVCPGTCGALSIGLTVMHWYI